MKHVICEGSREHVVSWYGLDDGTVKRVCSCPECEINDHGESDDKDFD